MARDPHAHKFVIHQLGPGLVGVDRVSVDNRGMKCVFGGVRNGPAPIQRNFAAYGKESKSGYATDEQGRLKSVTTLRVHNSIAHAGRMAV